MWFVVLELNLCAVCMTFTCYLHSFSEAYVSLGSLYTACAYFAAFALLCDICLNFAYYAHFFHKFSHCSALRLHPSVFCLARKRLGSSHLQHAHPFSSQHTCERPVLSPHLGPLCFGFFHLSLHCHQLGLKPALRSGVEMTGEGRESEWARPFLGENTLVLLELYLECRLGSCSCKTQKWPLKSGVKGACLQGDLCPGPRTPGVSQVAQ